MEKDNQLFDAISKLIKSRNQDTIQVFGHFYYEIEDIIKANDKDSNRIEHLLDSMLPFCFDEEILSCLPRKTPVCLMVKKLASNLSDTHNTFHCRYKKRIL